MADRHDAVNPGTSSGVVDGGPPRDEPDHDPVVDLRAQIEGLATALDRTRAALAEARQERDDLSAAARAEQVRAAALASALDVQLTEARSEGAAAREHAAGLAAHVAHVEQAHRDLLARLADAEDRDAALDHEVRALRRSHAYRVGRVVTSPVRVLRRWLRPR